MNWYHLGNRKSFFKNKVQVEIKFCGPYHPAAFLQAFYGLSLSGCPIAEKIGESEKRS